MTPRDDKILEIVRVALTSELTTIVSSTITEKNLKSVKEALAPELGDENSTVLGENV